jgi:hypothetical protein
MRSCAVDGAVLRVWTESPGAVGRANGKVKSSIYLGVDRLGEHGTAGLDCAMVTLEQRQYAAERFTLCRVESGGSAIEKLQTV